MVKLYSHILIVILCGQQSEDFPLREAETWRGVFTWFNSVGLAVLHNWLLLIRLRLDAGPAADLRLHLGVRLPGARDARRAKRGAFILLVLYGRDV